MAITPEIIKRSDFRIRFEKPGEATILVGPCAGRSWKQDKIVLDGRHYKCAGKVILKNGTELRANLPIRTHTFDFLEKEAVYCLVGEIWYHPGEEGFLSAVGLSAEEAFPYTWMPDLPLDYRVPGPYPMNWYDAVKAANSASK